MSDKKVDMQIIPIRSVKVNVITITKSNHPETPTSKIWKSIHLHPSCVICQKMIVYKQEQWTAIPDGLLGHKCPQINLS